MLARELVYFGQVENDAHGQQDGDRAYGLCAAVRPVLSEREPRPVLYSCCMCTMILQHSIVYAVQATFAVTFAVTVVFLLVCVTYVSFHLHFSTFGKNTLQKHYDGMVAHDINRTDSDSDSTSETGTVSRYHDAPTPGRVSPPDSLITRLLEPGMPHGIDGQTPTITEDEAMCVPKRCSTRVPTACVDS